MSRYDPLLQSYMSQTWRPGLTPRRSPPSQLCGGLIAASLRAADRGGYPQKHTGCKTLLSRPTGLVATCVTTWSRRNAHNIDSLAPNIRSSPLFVPPIFFRSVRTANTLIGLGGGCGACPRAPPFQIFIRPPPPSPATTPLDRHPAVRWSSGRIGAHWYPHPKLFQPASSSCVASTSPSQYCRARA